MINKIMSLKEFQSNLRSYDLNTLNIYGGITGTNWTSSYASFTPYVLKNGQIRCLMVFSGTISVAAAFISLTINGVTFEKFANQSLALAAWNAALVVAGNANTIGVGAGSSNLYLTTASNANAFYVNGDVALDSIPTWCEINL